MIAAALAFYGTEASGMNGDPDVQRTILAQLNEQQRTAVRHGDGPLLIVAGAGTGKTTTLAHRVAWLIAAGVDPSRILLLTFTRRASAEMLRRVEGILARLGNRGPHGLTSRRVWGGTFHAIASRLLRQHGPLIGLRREFTILDRGDSEDLMNVVRGELDLARSETRFPLKGTCQDLYSRCVNTQLGLEQVLKRDFPWCEEHGEALKRLFQAYTDRKEAQAVLDYDDLLVFWHGLLADPQAGAVIRAKFDRVLVDEYQDTNTLQAEIVRGLRPDGTGVTVVGDDAQSIYSFRAATVRNILDFPGLFPGTTVVPLEQNYRSTRAILDATNRVIAEAGERYEKDLWTTRPGGDSPYLVNCHDEDEQTDLVIDRILEHRENGIDLQQQAVLFRASHHSLALELELARRNIPFHKYGGLKFVETAHIKDLLALLRLAENPRDVVSALRALMLLPGIGQRKARQLTDLLQQSQGDFAVWKEYRPPAAAAAHWPLLVALLELLARRSGGEHPVAADVHQARTFYAPLLQQKFDRPQPRLRDLEQLEIVAARFPDRTTFLTEITLDPPSSTQDLPGDPLLDEDYLILSTIHSAKGLEWDAVYVLHAADGNIPSDMAKSDEEVEEERRLFYVALTRAKNWLYVCHPHRYYFHGRYRGDAHSFAPLTRFLTAEARERFQVRVAGTPPLADRPEAARSELTTAAIRGRLKSMWA
jgi:DNA helicase-2/ATP-dependent DNA helicase PcrA